MNDTHDAAVAESAPHDALEGQPILEVERDGTHYTLLGTAHVSRASVEAVEALIATRDFDAVAVESERESLEALGTPLPPAPDPASAAATTA